MKFPQLLCGLRPALAPLGLLAASLMLNFTLYPPATAAPAPQHVQQIDLIHFSHTDYGFTDHPAVCRDLQVRYLDVALDAIIATRPLPPEARFHWTAETTIAVLDWWQQASPARRQDFLQAVRDGQLEVTALPFNNTPFLNAEQWHTMTHWLPDELWQSFRPQTAVQNDVNGFPRAGAKALLDRGVRYLFTGINSDSGGPPFPRLSTFWWKQPDGRRLFVYMSLPYGDGFFFFESLEWRRGPLPRAADGTYRPPRAGDILKTDESSLRKAHERCLSRLQEFERNGYRLPVLAVSMTSMWRYDNDPPFPPIADFVAAWNRLGLQPRLRLTTVSEAMRDLEKASASSAPEYTGEWTDWWANGTACAPREVAASRFAKRFLTAAQSPVFGPLDPATRARLTELWQDLCLFDEHTWGSGMSVGQPYSLDSQGQWNEKARFAWRPFALAEWLLGQRARTRLSREAEGLWVANPTAAPFSGWASLITTCLRQETHALVDADTGQRARLYYEPGPLWGRPARPQDLSYEDVSATFPDRSPNRFARFWIENLPPHSTKRFLFSPDPGRDTPPPPTALTLTTNASGWPTSALWPGMSKPLFQEGMGDFLSVKVNGFAPRWLAQDIWHAQDPARKAQLQKERLTFTTATPLSPTTVEDNPHTLRYTQRFEHPRLQWGTRGRGVHVSRVRVCGCP
ncbi:MAG: hypothetical protein N3J91_00490, partial [Verrucomicrobiae bacterium]|nr:hypothetical protein [Verrucomicrobiae bacterium]